MTLFGVSFDVFAIVLGLGLVHLTLLAASDTISKLSCSLSQLLHVLIVEILLTQLSREGFLEEQGKVLQSDGVAIKLTL